jgi:hypothetical protein
LALIDEIHDICQDLAEQGWAELLGRHGLNIKAANLEAELAKPLEVKRHIAGFEDFAMEGVRGIEPGHPARSLLFHALASSNVLLASLGRRITRFATLRQLEVVENYVYGVRPPSLDELATKAQGKELGIVVFATEYRPASQTCHRKHADMVFARTGIARVGTAPPLYDGALRGFVPFVEEDVFDLRVLPAHYAAYIAVLQPGNAATFCPMRHRTSEDDGIGDENRQFWLPLHKLFSGAECLRDFGEGDGLSVELGAHHFNEKLRRIHLELRKRAGNGAPFDTGVHEEELDEAPFRFTQGIAAFSTQREDGTGLLVPQPHNPLIQPATRNDQPLGYNVPPFERDQGLTSFSSSFSLQGVDFEGLYTLPAPEYVHARHRIEADGSVTNLNDLDLTSDQLEALVRAGNYKAQHFIDFSGDGWIDVSCPQVSALLGEPRNAYSLVTAPDYFPTCDQRELTEWTEGEEIPEELKAGLWFRPPRTLSDIRFAPNLQLPGCDFTSADNTITAIVSLFGEEDVKRTEAVPSDPLRHSHLPDDAAGIFAPGWDVSLDVWENAAGNVPHLASYGLGSPFPEDAKLCAALSTFWPAVAPDVTRTMEPTGNNTVAPLTDEEVGQIGSLPWDGVPGPRIVQQGGEAFAEYLSFAHTDYVQNALDGLFTLAIIGKTGIEEYKDRVLSMALVNRELGGQRGQWTVFSFRALSAGDPELQEANVQAGVLLRGPVYRFEMIRKAAVESVPGNPQKKRMPIRGRRSFMVDPKHRRILVKQERWRNSTRPPL